ncbi:MAG TPA: pyridine nucleotide-disulfide oxidoreductase, partial [Brevundimonas sp.]|nr:pyridine nucleotide-disulfide oxidoreductase [Brevundimonas sp.]
MLAAFMADWHRQHDVEVLTGRTVTAMQAAPDGQSVCAVMLDDGRRIEAD